MSEPESWWDTAPFTKVEDTAPTQRSLLDGGSIYIIKPSIYSETTVLQLPYARSGPSVAGIHQGWLPFCWGGQSTRPMLPVGMAVWPIRTEQSGMNGDEGHYVSFAHAN